MNKAWGRWKRSIDRVSGKAAKEYDKEMKKRLFDLYLQGTVSPLNILKMNTHTGEITEIPIQEVIDQMKPTPRTDKARDDYQKTIWEGGPNSPSYEMVPIAFARELELELVVTIAKLEELEDEIQNMLDAEER